MKLTFPVTPAKAGKELQPHYWGCLRQSGSLSLIYMRKPPQPLSCIKLPSVNSWVRRHRSWELHFLTQELGNISQPCSHHSHVLPAGKLLGEHHPSSGSCWALGTGCLHKHHRSALLPEPPETGPHYHCIPTIILILTIIFIPIITCISFLPWASLVLCPWALTLPQLFWISLWSHSEKEFTPPQPDLCGLCLHLPLSSPSLSSSLSCFKGHSGKKCPRNLEEEWREKVKCNRKAGHSWLSTAI